MAHLRQVDPAHRQLDHRGGGIVVKLPVAGEIPVVSPMALGVIRINSILPLPIALDLHDIPVVEIGRPGTPVIRLECASRCRMTGVGYGHAPEEDDGLQAAPQLGVFVFDPAFDRLHPLLVAGVGAGVAG